MFSIYVSKKRNNNRLKTNNGFCKKCGVKIEKYKTDNGQEPKLCKKHYEMGKVAEARYKKNIINL